jgi:hypothetical protein
VASRPPNLFKLRKGNVFDDLFPRDFADVMWQAFERDKLESITLEISKPTERMRMLIIDVAKRKTKRP